MAAPPLRATCREVGIHSGAENTPQHCSALRRAQSQQKWFLRLAKATRFDAPAR